MRLSASVRVAIAVIALVAAAVGYRWWNGPERQLSRALAGVASALSHANAETDLQTLTAVGPLRDYLTADVSIDAGVPSWQLRGRDEVILMAARFRSSTAASRVQFFDPEIDWTGESSATVHVTVQVITRTSTHEEVADARRVTIGFTRADGRWLIARARVAPQQESRR